MADMHLDVKRASRPVGRASAQGRIADYTSTEASCFQRQESKFPYRETWQRFFKAGYQGKLSFRAVHPPRSTERRNDLHATIEQHAG